MHLIFHLCIFVSNENKKMNEIRNIIFIDVINIYDQITLDIVALSKTWNGMEWNGMDWNGMEWFRMEWNGMDWNGMEFYQVHFLLISNLPH